MLRLSLSLATATLLVACDDARTVSPPTVTPRADAAAPGADVDAGTTTPADDATVHDDATADPIDGGGDAPDGGGELPDGGPAPEPIPTNPRTWVWADFPESACDDGTTTGIGVNASATSDNLLIFMNGGGACWDYATCVELNTSAHGPFGGAQFAQISPLLVGGAYSRTLQANPFRDWSYAFVPYCTGDLHAGSKVTEYTNGGARVSFHHVGHDNMLAFIARLKATFPNPSKVVLSGSSAGGYGTLFNYDAARAAWPDAQMYLVDDSGPLLGGDAIPPALRTAWSQSWGIDALLDQVCNGQCTSDFSRGYGALAARYPNDRLALLSSLQDDVIRQYMGLTAPAFQTALLAAATGAIEPTSNFEYFLVTGTSHTMLGSPDQFVSNGTNLFVWLTRMVTDDAAWASTRP